MQNSNLFPGNTDYVLFYRVLWLENVLPMVISEHKTEYKRAKKRFKKIMKDDIPFNTLLKGLQIESFLSVFLADGNAEMTEADVAFFIKSWLQDLPEYELFPGIPLTVFQIEIHYKAGDAYLVDTNIKDFHRILRQGGIDK